MLLLAGLKMKKLNVLYQNDWLEEVEKTVLKYQKDVEQLVTTMRFNHSLLHREESWSFFGSFYYSFSLLTTVGSDYSTNTLEGKIFTVLYSSIGVPLMFIVLSHCGGIVENTLESVYHQIFHSESHCTNNFTESVSAKDDVKRLVLVEVNACKSTPVSKLITHAHDTNNRGAAQSRECKNWHRIDLDPHKSRCSCMNDQHQIPPMLFVVIITVCILLYVLAGSYLLHVWRNCPFEEVAYFSFYSVIPIGYSTSYHQLCNSQTVSNDPLYTLFVCPFFFLGMSLLTAVFLKLINRSRDKCNKNFHTPKNVLL